MNCHAPDTGNIELLAKYCNTEQKKKWLQPLLNGEASSAYSMTEPDVASSDATNVACSIRKDGSEYVINGRKLYGNSIVNKNMKFFILMGCSNSENPDPWKIHSMVIVPSDTRGLSMKRNLTIMGYDHAPAGHGEFVHMDVRIPVENIILGEGRAFEIARGGLDLGEYTIGMLYPLLLVTLLIHLVPCSYSFLVGPSLDGPFYLWCRPHTLGALFMS